jgi:hypothetical protein
VFADAIQLPLDKWLHSGYKDKDKQDNAMAITFNGGISTDKETMVVMNEQGNELLHHLHLSLFNIALFGSPQMTRLLPLLFEIFACFGLCFLDLNNGTISNCHYGTPL